MASGPTRRPTHAIMFLAVVFAVVLAATVAPAGPAGAAEPADTVGLVDTAQGLWHLRDGDGDTATFYFGDPGDHPIMGDWDCDGTATPGMFRRSDGFVYLRNTNTQGIADIAFFFGDPGDVPIVGDFDGDGCDTVAVYRPSEGRAYIIDELGEDGGGLGAAHTAYYFGNPGDTPFVGDFDGDGIDTVGLHRGSTGLVYVRNSHSPGPADTSFVFGDPGDRLVAGDWGVVDGVDTPAVFRPGSSAFHFRHTNTEGIADETLVWGNGDWVPVAGAMGDVAATPPPTTGSGASGPHLAYSLSPARTAARPLDGATLRSSDAVYVFLAESRAGTERVVFEGPHGTQTENVAPWDYRGGTASKAKPATFGTGTHTITADPDPGPVVTATFTVVGDGPADPADPVDPTDPVDPADPVDPGDVGRSGRVAWSADGNWHDRDDVAAAAVAVALMARSGGDFVHFHHSSHIWDTSDVREEEMRASSEDVAQVWGLDTSVYYNAVDELEEATDHLAAEIDRSTADDPLWIIIAGPVETVAMAIEKSDPAARAHVIALSHSTWNNDHAGTHGGRDFDDLPGMGVATVKIKDQNANLNEPYADFHWARDSSDARIRLLWDRAQVAGKSTFDTSDAGMMWWWLTGDERGSPDDLRAYLGG